MKTLGRAIATLTVATCLTVGSLAGLSPANAETRPPVKTETGVKTQSDKRALTEYWTPDRMRAAKPVQKTSESTVRMPRAAASAEAEKQDPRKEHGKVFFTRPDGDYECSGTSVQSANMSVVATAGHCAYRAGAAATNWIFAPAYNEGATPLGKWTASALFTTDQWKQSADFNFDTAFAVVNPNEQGQTLGEAVGAIPIAFNLERGLNYSLYGYPAADPYDGESFWRCQGAATDDQTPGSTGLAVPCTMAGGSSGGGWITADGTLNGINSFVRNTTPDVMYGPYFGDEIKNVYDQAAGTNDDGDDSDDDDQDDCWLWFC